MAKTIAVVLGVVFLIVGLLGLIPGNGIVGDGALFQANMAHNIIHLVSGLIFLLVASKAPSSSSMTMKILGVVYLLVAILGFFVSGGDLLGFISINPADNWLHLVLGLVILIAGLSTKDTSSAM